MFKKKCKNPKLRKSKLTHHDLRRYEPTSWSDEQWPIKDWTMTISLEEKDLRPDNTERNKETMEFPNSLGQKNEDLRRKWKRRRQQLVSIREERKSERIEFIILL